MTGDKPAMGTPPDCPAIRQHWEAIMSCIGCGDCGFAIRPAVGRFLACPVKEALGEAAFEPSFSRGKMGILKSVLEGSLPLASPLVDIAYQCTECGACTETCHQTRNPNVVLNTSKWIDHVEIWNAVRKDLIAAKLAPLGKHAAMLQGIADGAVRNPYGEPVDRKRAWLVDRPGTGAGRGESLALFGGCTFPLRLPSTLRNLATIIEQAGFSLVMADEEWCCGSVAFRVGDPAPARPGIERTIASLERTGVGTVVTACAGCYRTMVKDWPALAGGGLPFRVVHVTEFLLELVRKGGIVDLAPDRPGITVTYHDPCHLGRHMGIYDAPREVLASLPGMSLVELPRTRHAAWCCGAGGGVKSAYPDLASRVASDRVEEARQAGVDAIVSSCPFCELTLAQAARDAGIPVDVVDIVDLVAARLFPPC